MMCKQMVYWTVLLFAVSHVRADFMAKNAENFARFPDKSKGPQRGYTWAEVAQFDGCDGRRLYIVISDKVYDVTDFADYHPAGPEPLKAHAGADATAAFKAAGMPSQVLDVFAKRFLVGWIVN